MARKTSFYYAFLVLPADQRRAIIAVWDFCRAVDDAVDESTTGAREAVAFWRAELARCYEGGAPQTSQGQQLQPLDWALRSSASSLRGRHRRRRDGSRQRAVPDVRGSLRVLPAGRGSRRADLHPDLRLPGSAGTGVRRQSRSGAAADEHPAGHQGRPRSRSCLSAARGPRGYRMQRGRSLGRTNVGARTARHRIRMSTSAGFLSPCARGASPRRIGAGSSPPRSCGRSISKRSDVSNATATTSSQLARACPDRSRR